MFPRLDPTRIRALRSAGRRALAAALLLAAAAHAHGRVLAYAQERVLPDGRSKT